MGLCNRMIYNAAFPWKDSAGIQLDPAKYHQWPSLNYRRWTQCLTFDINTVIIDVHVTSFGRSLGQIRSFFKLQSLTYQAKRALIFGWRLYYYNSHLQMVNWLALSLSMSLHRGSLFGLRRPKLIVHPRWRRSFRRLVTRPDGSASGYIHG